MGFRGFGVLGFRGFGVLGLWGCGVLGFWGFGVLGFWGLGVLGFWGLGFEPPAPSPRVEAFGLVLGSSGRRFEFAFSFVFYRRLGLRT